MVAGLRQQWEKRKEGHTKRTRGESVGNVKPNSQQGNARWYSDGATVRNYTMHR